jgi:hypothetical protein
MSLAVIKEALGRRPFETFRIRMSSGDAYEVRHPEMTLLLRGGVYSALPMDSSELPDRPVYCSLLHVAPIEILASA